MSRTPTTYTAPIEVTLTILPLLGVRNAVQVRIKSVQTKAVDICHEGVRDAALASAIEELNELAELMGVEFTVVSFIDYALMP